MKISKKITAFVLAVALLASGMNFTHAATVSQEAKNLNKLGLLLNISEGELSQELNRVFGITMVMKTLGYEDADVKELAPFNRFTDLNAHWARGFAVKAYQMKLTTGINNEHTLFGPQQKLTKKHLLTFMLRALGHDGGKAWNQTESLAREAGILTENSVVDTQFTKDDAAIIMYKAIQAKKTDGGRLIDDIVAKKPEKKPAAMALGLIVEQPQNLMVESVVAESLREIKVRFNSELNPDTALKLSNYQLKGKGVASRVLSAVKLTEDKRGVSLTVGPLTPNPLVLEQGKNYALKMKNLKNVNGDSLTETEEELTVHDKVTPTVKSVVFTGPKMAEIHFNEPMQAAGTVEIYQGGTKLSGKMPELTSNETVARVETFMNFKEGAEYEFRIRQFRDFAGYVNIDENMRVKFEKMSGIPTSSVLSANEKTVVIEFNRPVKGVTSKHFYHSFPSKTAKGVYKDEARTMPVTQNDWVTKIWVHFADAATGVNENPLYGTSVGLHRLGKANGIQIVDQWGNAAADEVYTLSIDADTAAPKVVDVTAESDTKIVVTFDEELSEKGSYRILKADGSSLLTTPTATLNGKKVHLVFSKFAPQNVILEIKNVKDKSLSQNTLLVDTRAVTFNDMVFEGVEGADFVNQADSGKIYLRYKELVGNTAIDLNNYRLEYAGQQYPITDQSIEFGTTNQTVIITLNRAVANNVVAHLGTAKIIVGTGVTDTAGNASFNPYTMPLTSGVAATISRSDFYREGDTTRVEITFNREIAQILDERGFTLDGAAAWYEGSEGSAAAGNIVGVYIKDSDRKVIIVNLDKVAYTGGFSIRIAPNIVQDIQGMNVLGAVTTPTDKVKPAVKTISGQPQVRAIKSGSGDYLVEITYTEGIAENSLASGTYQVAGLENVKIEDRPTVAGNTVKVKLVLPGGFSNFTQDFFIVQSSDLTDTAGNRLEASSAQIPVIRDGSWQ